MSLINPPTAQMRRCSKPWTRHGSQGTFWGRNAAGFGKQAPKRLQVRIRDFGTRVQDTGIETEERRSLP